jgi:hypothetical protein
MIIVKLSGGLGNQMFQAATGEAISRHFKTELKFDLSFLEKNNSSTTTFTTRKFRLDSFKFALNFANEKELRFFFPDSKSNLILWSQKIRKKVLKCTVLIDTWNFQNIFNYTTKCIYLDGFWQSEDYFKAIRASIINLFRFPAIPFNSVPLLQSIKSTNSISIHFRRGDYVNNEHISSIHNVCDLTYYERAIDYITERQKAIKLFLFSDEPEWLFGNFKSEFEFEIVKTDSDITDMHLMSRCRHNIIANSSFSWWAAWLNQNPDKIVIAPKKWFATDIANYENVVPISWIKI